MNQKGFTLIELVIVMGIMGVMFLIVAFSSSSFNDRIALKKATDEISFLFRQAQVEGLAVLEDPDFPGEYNIGYGVYVRIDGGGTNASSNSLIYFVDRDDDGRYGGNFICNGECQSEVELDRVIITNVDSDCNNSAQGLSSVFRRPRPEIAIKAHSGNPSQVCTELILTLQTLSPEASEATVTIKSAAEINVVYN